MRDGRKSLREMDVESGEKMIMKLPLLSDYDAAIQTYKYAGKTLGQINEIDKGYIKWAALESNAPSRLKLVCARLYYDEPYVCKAAGEIIEEKDLYQNVIKRTYELMVKLKEEHGTNHTPA